MVVLLCLYLMASWSAVESHLSVMTEALVLPRAGASSFASVSDGECRMAIRIRRLYGSLSNSWQRPSSSSFVEASSSHARASWKPSSNLSSNSSGGSP